MKSLFFALLMTCVLTSTVFLGCARGQRDAPQVVTKDWWSPENYCYDTLVEAARREGSVTVRWHSGRVLDAARAFEAAYGIRVLTTGRFDEQEIVELLRREHAANNVQADAITLEDEELINEFIRLGLITNWVPPDLAHRITSESLNPLVYLYQPVVLGFNSAVYNTSPITNLWELTEERWRGKVALCDPFIQPYMWHLFSGAIDKADEFEQAYMELYGRPLVTQEKNAGWEWVIRMFRNNMLLVRHDTEVARAIGSPGQTEPPVGFFTLTRFRDAAEQNLNLGFCPNVVPFVGFALPTFAIIPVNAPNPNAARLWIRWVLTSEGHEPWSSVIGGFSPNIDVTPADNPLGGWDKWVNKLIIFDGINSARNREELQDLLLINRGR